MTRSPVILTLLLSCLAGTAARPGGAAAEVPQPPAEPAALPQLIGFNLPLTHLDHDAAALEQLDKLADLGCNAVQVLVPIYQAHADSPAPAIEQRPLRGPTDDTLLAVLTRARALGLFTSVLPCVELTAPRGGEDRRDINPTDRVAWWAGYRAAVGHYARLAQRGHADVFVVGTELASLLGEHDEPSWRALIADTRRAFQGRLTLAADAAQVPRVRFWDALDCVGVWGFWSMAGPRQHDLPRERELDTAWKDPRRDLLQTARRHHRPVLIAAVGYPSRPSGLRDPRDAHATPGVTAEPAIQTAGYRALLRNWDDLLPAPAGSGDPDPLLGVFFHAWSIGPSAGPFDPGYSPRGKLAEAVLRRYLASGRIE